MFGFLCYISSSVTYSILHILLLFHYVSTIAQMGFILFRQATECCRAYLPRPPPLPDPTLLHTSPRIHQLILPPVLAWFLLWYTGKDDAPATLQFIGMFLVLCLIRRWVIYSWHLCGNWLDKFGCPRDKTEISFRNGGIILLPAPSCIVKFEEFVFSSAFNLAIVLFQALRCFGQLLPRILMRRSYIFVLDSIFFHLQDLFGDGGIILFTLLLNGAMRRAQFLCNRFLSHSLNVLKAIANLYSFFRFDVFSAWSESGDSLCKLQQDLSRLLSVEAHVTCCDEPDWIEPFNDVGLRDPVHTDVPSYPVIEFSQQYSIESSYFHPTNNASARMDLPPWRHRRWYHRATAKFEAAPSVPLFVPPPNESTPQSLRFDRLKSFIRSFNPAVAGIFILDAERYDHVHVKRPSSETTPQEAPPDDLSEDGIEYTTVHLRNCAKSLLARFKVNQVLPRYYAHVHEVIGSVYQAVTNPNATPLIVDTGASCCITPHRHDFVEGSYTESEVKIKDLSGLNKVAGRGLIRWKIRDRNGQVQTLEIDGFHVPNASVRLMSPQSVFKTLGGTGGINHLRFVLFLQDDVTLVAPYNLSNLPVLPLVDSVSSTAGLWHECFGFNSEMRQAWARGTLDAANQNLSLAQKEILLWHQRLSHANISAIHNLARQKSRTKKVSNEAELVALRDGPLLPCTHNVPNAVCDNLVCAACAISKASRRKPSVRSPGGAILREKVLKENDLRPGDRISCDHYISPIPGRAVADSGHSSTRHGFVGGTIYVDHASGYIFHRPQKTLTAADTIRGKLILEQEAADVGIRVKRYHSDNGVFSSREFRDHCEALKQKLRFSGVGAKFQNGVAERSIQTVCNMARSNIVHATLHNPQYKFISLWALAMDYAVWCYNQLPPGGHGLSPEELWSSIKSPRSGLPRAHVFGCPVYVLDPTLQDGGKIPKWNSRARQGIFVGFSTKHSSTVPLVFNPSTQHISPQYHVIFDDTFSSVPSFTTPAERDEIFAKLFHSSREKYIDELDPSASDIQLDKEWLESDESSVEGAVDGVPEGAADGVSEGAVDGIPEGAVGGTSEGAVGGTSEGAVGGASEGAVDSDSEGDSIGGSVDDVPVDNVSIEDGVLDTSERVDATMPPSLHRNEQRPMPPNSPSPRQLRSSTKHSWRDGPVKLRPNWKSALLATFLTLPCYALQSINECTQPPALSANFGSKNGSLRNHHRIRRSHLNELSLFQNDWSEDAPSIESGISVFSSYVQPDLSDDIGSYTVTDVQPHILKAKAVTHDADNPTYTQAMNSPQQDFWYDAMVVEYETLLKIKAWILVKRLPGMKILPMTWAFKLKRYPDGLAKKFKARFCVRGDKQVEGIDFFETWAPVVQWTTVRSMMILATNRGLCSAQADITAAFVHAPLEEDEEIYVHQPRGFEVPGDYVLKLNRSVYGIKQAPRNFFKYLRKHLQKQGLKQSEFDPCLFVGPKVTAIVYVDDILFFAANDDDINAVILALQKQDIQIRREGSAEGFLGVAVERFTEGNTKKIRLTQEGLAKRVIEALGLCNNYSTKISTPAEASPLPKDADGDPPSGTFNYGSVVGMLLYLCGHSRPDIAFAVHQCARYTFKPTRRHEKALVRIGRYLKGTVDKGITMSPSTNPCIDCYPDADFAGLYGHEDVQDPHCVRSRSGFVILAFGCPVVWKSKLQTEIALSTMEAEYVAISTACRDLLPVINIVKSLSASVGYDTDFVSNIHVRIHEDNVGALTLGKMEPRRYTPRSKHYAIKYHWFREHVADKSKKIQLVKIDTKNQLGDIFTKGLTQVPFEHLRRLLMGW